MGNNFNLLPSMKKIKIDFFFSFFFFLNQCHTKTKKTENTYFKENNEGRLSIHVQAIFYAPATSRFHSGYNSETSYK